MYIIQNFDFLCFWLYVIWVWDIILFFVLSCTIISPVFKIMTIISCLVYLVDNESTIYAALEDFSIVGNQTGLSCPVRLEIRLTEDKGSND